MSKFVGGDGPIPCSVMLIGQRPGIEEVRRGKPFVGKAGMELDRYLSVNAGIDRSRVYVTNLVKTFDGVDDITLEEIERDLPELQRELCEVRPQYVGLVGLYAARHFLGGVDLEWSYGLQFYNATVFNSVDKMMPLYHPAAGLHQPSIAVKIAAGFEAFGRMLRGESRALPIDSYTNPLYKETDCGVLLGTVAVDTEGTPEKPWCLSFSVLPGKAYVMRSTKELEVGESLVVLHNSLHDLPMLEAMGVTIPKWTDTMLMANLLGVEPLGLKALARRHTGMAMASYEEVTAEAKRDKALEHISRVIDYAEAYANAENTAPLV